MNKVPAGKTGNEGSRRHILSAIRVSGSGYKIVIRLKMRDVNLRSQRSVDMPNVAVLIDAENVLPVYAHQIFECAAARGSVCAKEIYGAAPALTTWVEPVLEYAMHANLTIKASKWKNSSDIALVIGAMDLLLAGNVNTVILVSSDSDFSALSVRLRLAGLEVVGMGTEKSNDLWRKACTEFVMLQTPASGKAAQNVQPAAERKPQSGSRSGSSRASNSRSSERNVQDAASKAQPAAAVKPAAVQNAPAPVPAPQEEATVKAAPRKAAATHAARTEVIRDYIQSQLDENHGKMALSVLFQNLRSLPEYQVDQRGSKRKPLNYLMWLFGDRFSFEDAGSGGTWISEKTRAAAEVNAEEQNAPETGEQPKERTEAAETPSAETAEKELSAEAFSPVAMAAAGEAAVPAETEDKTEPEKHAEAAEKAADEKGGEKPRKAASSWSGAVMASLAEAQKKHSAEAKAEETKKTSEKPAVPAKAEEPAALQKKPVSVSLYDIGLQNRPLTTLISQGYHTLEDVAKLSDQELMAIKNIGVVTVDQIRRAARKAGL